MQQQQFLHVLDRDTAEQRFQSALDLTPLSAESVSLPDARRRVLAEDVIASVDVPSFDRSNMDGFAVRAQDTFGATEDEPVLLHMTGEMIRPGDTPAKTVVAGTTSAIATGAMIPRGADAVVMIEHTEARGEELVVWRPVAPGANVTFAGADIAQGETVLRRGELLTSRETGVLAAIGVVDVRVIRRPRVAVLSTGNELIAPGKLMRPGLIYDSNAVILADAVRELGGEPMTLGIVADDKNALHTALEQALCHDVVLLSGGTSKGDGDLSYRVIADLGEPGIVAHGIALKPGKPLCLAAVRRADRTVPVVILPGFPTSAIFTFHEFVAPVIRRLGGRVGQAAVQVSARLPMRVNSERGRTEYLLVGLVDAKNEEAKPQAAAACGLASAHRESTLTAYPMGKGSGSVTTFSKADGFIVIPQHQEYLDAGMSVSVQLLDPQFRPADLVVIGSHCTGLDLLLSQLQQHGFTVKIMVVGSSAGLQAAQRGECDVAGIHLLDEKTGTYNVPFVDASVKLLPGYRRMQGVLYRKGDARFDGQALSQVLHNARADGDCVMVNRNRGSGTRILLDRLLREHGASEPLPVGYHTEAKSHNAVAAAIAQGRADWGLAIQTVAAHQHLGFLQVREEHYDFVIPAHRWDEPAVTAFRHLLQQPSLREQLTALGFDLHEV